MTPLFLGGRLNLATCIQMEMFKMQGGRVFVNHHGQALFPLPNPAKTNCADASNWVYDDDIDAGSDEEPAQSQGGAIGGRGSGGGMEDVAGGSGAVPPEEEMYEPPFTRSRAESSSGFNEAHFYQYMDEHFSRLNLRLDAIDERQQQAAQDQSDMLRRQMEFDSRQRNLEHHVYYAYEHHGWPYPPPEWRPSGPPGPY